jgi:hypothetical protein
MDGFSSRYSMKQILNNHLNVPTPLFANSLDSYLCTTLPDKTVTQVRT